MKIDQLKLMTCSIMPPAFHQSRRRIVVWLCAVFLVALFACKSNVEPTSASDCQIFSVTVMPDKPVIEVGKTVTLSATVLQENCSDTTVVWTSQDTTIATVSQAGVVTGVDSGSVEIVATVQDKSGSSTITVMPSDCQILKVSVMPDRPIIEVGQTVPLSATVQQENCTDTTVVWSTRDSTIATVSQDGVVTGVDSGSVEIIATVQDKSGSSTVTVMPHPPCQLYSISIDSTKLTLVMGETKTLTITFVPAECSSLPITWTSEDSTVAYVSQKGEVTGVWPGRSLITATVQGKGAWCEVTVVPVLPAGKIMFEYLPVDPEQTIGFVGMGGPNVLPEDHGGFLFTFRDWIQEGDVPVYALADGWIEGLIFDDIPNWGYDLSMRIRYSTTIHTNYGHMDDFSQEIWDTVGTLTLGDHTVHIPVHSGQVVGYKKQGNALDFYIGDEEVQLHFLRPDRYPYPMLKAGYYFDYFEEPLLSQFLNITIRQDEPRGGKIDYDIAGKIIGNWFLEGTIKDRPVENLLAIVYDFVDGTKIAIADGTTRAHGEIEAAVYWVEGNAPRPENVGVEQGLVKYEIRQRWFKNATYREHRFSEILGTFMVQMIEPGRIRVEKVLGKRADEVAGFSAAAKIYER